MFSLLRRFLEHEGYAATLVVNVTDVNDKIYDAAAAEGRPSAQLAAEMTAAYRADTDGLGLGRPDHEPLASETIGPIIDYIAVLIEAGHAYAAEGDVYFRVRSDPGYGSLSHRQLDSMDQGEGVEGAHLKADPLDWLARMSDHIVRPRTAPHAVLRRVRDRVRVRVSRPQAVLAKLGTPHRQGLPGGSAPLRPLRQAHEHRRLRHRRLRHPPHGIRVRSPCGP